jgi:hypothetical protein
MYRSLLLVIFLLNAALPRSMALAAAPAPQAGLLYGAITFSSQFPTGATMSIEVTAPAALQQARLFITLDGVTTYSSDALVPANQPNETVRLEARWNGLTLTRDPSPPWMSLQFWWEVSDYAGNRITTPPEQHLYGDSARRAWVASEGLRVTVYTYGQSNSFINNALALGDEAMGRLQNAYGYTLPYRPALIFYNSPSEGDFDIGTSVFGAYVVGRAYPGTSGVVMLARNDNAFLGRIIIHELAHLYQYQIGPRLFDAPHWWIEGDAKAQEPPASIERSISYAKTVANGEGLPDLTTWDSRNYSSEASLDHALLLGASFVTYLKQVYGNQSLASFYANWRVGQSFRDAFVNTFGVGLGELGAGWRAWVNNSQAAVVVENSLPAPTIPAVILPPIPEGMARVNAYWLNFRDGPSEENEVLALLSIGQLLLPIGRNETADWLLVELPDGTQGWLFGEYVDYDGDLNALTISLYRRPEP